MNEDLLINQLKIHEGFVPHAYKDSEGYLTIGYGRLIDKSLGGGITKEEANYLLLNDIKNKTSEIRKALPWFDTLTDSQQRALVNMTFQMGITRLLGFRKALTALKNKDLHTAQKEFLDSKWARQTPIRVLEVSAMIML